MNYSQKIAERLGLRPNQVSAALDLLDAGNTIPFIARYRKEATFNLDEFEIRQINETVTQLRAVDERRETIIKSVEEQGQLTPDLKKQISAAETLTELEDLYLPYKPRRRTRAMAARERGLQALADMILAQATSGPSPEDAARKYLGDEVPTAEDALAGARDIVAETISDDARVRGFLREKALEWGTLSSTRIKDSDDPKNTYETYYEFTQRLDRLRPYQVLAINRGESEKILRVKVEVPERDQDEAITTYYRTNYRSPFMEQMLIAIDDAAKRLLMPAIERDLRRTLTEEAETHAIQVFAENLKGLLNQPPLADRVVMGLDPAYRTGCKVAVVDATGKMLTTDTIYPHPPQRRHDEALKTLARLIRQYGVSLIAIGNGTASRETEALVAELTREMADVHYLMVNEAGASVYSASDLARAELPDMDVSLRGAVSIARRAQDPLAELVKIDPKSIGVGLYQHDVNQKALSGALDAVVESAVNQVGVDVNTASPALLQYVAGIGPKLAERIVAHRDELGVFKNRSMLKKVSGLGAKAFEQSAGFLRVRDGDNPLDASAIHPESYSVAKKLLRKLGISPGASPDVRAQAVGSLRASASLAQVAQEIGAGELTLADILDQIVQPGRDPRADLPAPILRSDVLSMDDLTEGMRLDGTVRNVVDFGAFIDIGVKQDGLLHISQIPRGKSLSVGDVLSVRILSVDQERGRIGLGWAGQEGRSSL